MNYVTVEVFEHSHVWALATLCQLGFEPLRNLRQVKSVDPETGNPTLFVRGKFAGDPASLSASPSVVGVYGGNGIAVLIGRPDAASDSSL